MSTQEIGVILNGVTGRMGTNQHLVRSIKAIIEAGGVPCGDRRLIPVPVLTGRSEEKLARLSAEHGVARYTTDLDSVLADPDLPVFFDASGTPYRAGFLERAIAAGKHIYCEKPTAASSAEALRLAELAESAGVKNGAVQDKLWLPGIRGFLGLRDAGFFGEILSVRGEFGYWVFTGHDPARPPQRPSWNYRSEDGGGIDRSTCSATGRYVISTTSSAPGQKTSWPTPNTDLPERAATNPAPSPSPAPPTIQRLRHLQDSRTGPSANSTRAW